MKNVLVINGANFSTNAVEQISFIEPLPALNEWVSGLGSLDLTEGRSLDYYFAGEGFVYDNNSVVRTSNGDFFSGRNINKICAYIQANTAHLIVGAMNKSTSEMVQLADFELSNYTSDRVSSITDGKNIINCNLYIPQNCYLYIKCIGTGQLIVTDSNDNTQYRPCKTLLHGGSKIQLDGTLVTRTVSSMLIDFYV